MSALAYQETGRKSDRSGVTASKPTLRSRPLRYCVATVVPWLGALPGIGCRLYRF